MDIHVWRQPAIYKSNGSSGNFLNHCFALCFNSYESVLKISRPIINNFLWILYLWSWKTFHLHEFCHVFIQYLLLNHEDFAFDYDVRAEVVWHDSGIWKCAVAVSFPHFIELCTKCETATPPTPLSLCTKCRVTRFLVDSSHIFVSPHGKFTFEVY